MAKKSIERLYRLVDDNFGDDMGPITLQEFREAARELGWPQLELVEDTDGTLMARVIYDEARYCIYEGEPGFDRLTWYKSGANWRAVLRPCTEEELRKTQAG